MDGFVAELPCTPSRDWSFTAFKTINSPHEEPSAGISRSPESQLSHLTSRQVPFAKMCYLIHEELLPGPSVLRLSAAHTHHPHQQALAPVVSLAQATTTASSQNYQTGVDDNDWRLKNLKIPLTFVKWRCRPKTGSLLAELMLLARIRVWDSVWQHARGAAASTRHQLYLQALLWGWALSGRGYDSLAVRKKVVKLNSAVGNRESNTQEKESVRGCSPQWMSSW